MDKIKIFAQAYTIPKNGGVFWYDVLSTYKDISWNDVEFNITGASVAERDTTNDRFSLNFSSTTTTRTISGTIQFRFTDGEYYTYDFSTTQTGDSGYTYIQDNIQSEIVAGDSNKWSVRIKSNESFSSPAVTIWKYDKTNHLVQYNGGIDWQVTLTEDYSDAYLFNSISEFRDACIAGTITNGKWVYVKGVAQDVRWVDSSSFAYLTFTDPNSDYELSVINVYNLGNVPYTSSNYTDAQYITTLGFSYNSSTTWGSNTYSVASSRLPFAYTQNGVTTTPGARNGRTPVEPIFSGYKASGLFYRNDLGVQAFNYMVIKDGSKEITTTILKQAGQAGSISVEYPTMTVSGRIDTYYNKITHPNIAVSNISYSASGTGGITPSIVTIDGEQYVKLEVVTSNIGAESSRSKTVTVKGVDGTDVTRTTEFTITQTNDEPKINVTPLYASDRPLQIGWQGQDVTFQLSCTNIASIDEVRWSMGVPAEQQSLEYTLTEKSYGWDCVVTIPQNPTEDYNQSKIIFKGTTTYTPASSEYNYLDSPYVRQEATPPGTITVTTSNPYLHSYAQKRIFIYYTTEWMDDNTITPTVTGDLIDPNSLVWNTINKYVSFTVTENTTNSERQATITLTGTDHIGVTRTTEYTVTQVPLSQDSFIRNVTIAFGTTYPYKNATVTGSFRANNVDNIRFEPSNGTTFIESLTITPGVVATLYNFEATLSQNTTDSPRSNYYRFVGDNTLQDSIWGATIKSSTTHRIFQKCMPGSITLQRNSILVPAGSTADQYRHLDNIYYPFRLNGDVTAELSGEVQGDLSFYTYDNKNYVVFDNYTNETGRELTGTITLTGTDYNGDTITASYTVVQTADNPYVIFDPWVWGGTGDGVPIMWDETETTFTVTVNRIISLSNFHTSASTTPSGNYTPITGYTLAEVSGNRYTLVINTAVNSSRNPYKGSFLWYDWETEYGQNPFFPEGEHTSYLGEHSITSIKKYAIPGEITITPKTVSVDGHSGTTSLTYSKDQWMNDDLQFSHSGTMNITKFSVEGNQIVVEYGENRTTSDKVETITITGTDYQGLTITATATITQAPLSYIEFMDTEITLESTQSTANFRLEDFGVSNVTASFSGNVDITNYSFSKTSYGHILSVTTADNLEYVVKNTTITVSAIGQLGERLSTTAILHKNGKDGDITLSPTTKYGSALGGVVEFTSVTNGMDSIDSYTANGGLAITDASIWGSPVQFTIGEYNLTPVYWDDKLTTSVYLTGTDYKGKTIRSNTVSIVQYGTDPSMTVTPESTEMSFEGGTASFNVTLTGAVPVPTVNVNGTTSWASEWTSDPTRTNTLRVSIPANNTFAEKRIPVTITSTALTGEVFTKEVYIIQEPKEGGIVLDPATKFVEKEAGTTQFSILLDGVLSSTLTLSYTGDSITSAVFNANKTGVIVTYKANTKVGTVINQIIVSGSDELGNSTTGTADLFQYGTDPSIAVDTIGIPNTQSSKTVFIATDGVGDLSVTFEGDVAITDYTLSEATGGYNLTIITEDNLENDPLYSTATFTGTVTTGRYQGQTIRKEVRVIKYGKEGKIYVEPSSVIFKKAGGTVTINLVYNNMDVSTITTSDGTFNSDKSQLTYTIGANPNLTDRSATITISGTDINGVTRTATVTVLQYGTDPYISITPSSRTLLNNESQATFSVTAYKTNNLTVAFDGALNIINYSLENGTLTVETGPNEELLSIIELITITGTSDNGETITATATITKFGTGGGLVIDPEFTIAGGADGENGMLIVPYLTDRIKENTVYAFINGDIDVKSIIVIRAGKFVAIEYTHNTSSESKVSTLTLTSYDEDDVPRIVTSTITQLPSQYTFTIKPPTRWLEHTSGSTTGTVKSENMTAVTSFNHFGDMEASYDNSLNGTINVTYQANSEVYAKWIALSITGVSSSGDTVVTSAWYIQRSSNYDDYEFKFLDTSQYDITVDGGGRKIYYDIISTLGSDVIPYSITGFILKGYWTNLPSVRYNNGDPYLVIPINIREAVRSVELSFLQEQSYRTLYAIVHQEEGAEPDVHPIWETSKLTSPNGTFIEYHITNDGDIIYAGKAYRFPEEFETVWSVNDITSNYLGNGIYFTEGIQQIPNYAKDFFIGTSANAKYVKTFYNSWAYKNTDYWLSDPIDHRVDPRQWLPVSFLSTNQHLITIGGRVYAALKENDGWTVMTNLKNYTLDCDAGITAVGTGSINYTVSNGDYVLYYSNAYGGWDSLLVTGTTKKTDDIEHLTYKKRSRNMSQFSKVNYQNNITPTWSLNTGITIDGSKMYHLLESTMVYLHNLETNEIIPVVITNSQCEYLTYRNNGRRPYYYNITVEESNNKLRK